MDAEGPMVRVPDAGRRISGRSGLLPLRAVDPTLTQDASEQFPADVALMGVRDPEGHVAAHHELVSPAGVGSLETQGPQRADQVRTADGTERRVA